jgi:uncharacterized protein
MTKTQLHQLIKRNYLEIQTNLRRVSMTPIIIYLLVGATAGILSGIVGLGGGIIMVPALIFLFGMNQHQAQGTTLAIMVPPIGLLAAWAYYSRGYVNLKIAAYMAIGFFFGGLIGGKIAVHLPGDVLAKIFGIVLAIIAVKMMISGK